MTPLADALIRSTLVLVAGLAAVFVLRQRSSALRHWILAATIASAALAAPLAWLLPAWPAAALPAPPALAFDAVPFAAAPADSVAAASALADSPTAAPRIPTRAIPLGLIWAIGFAIGAGALLLQILRLAAISARAPRVGGSGMAPHRRRSVAQVTASGRRFPCSRRHRTTCWRRGACSDRAFSCRPAPPLG